MENQENIGLINGKQKNSRKITVGFVSQRLREMGLPVNLKGYKFIRSAVMICVENEHIYEHVCKELYPAVAKLYDTTPMRVERAIRHSIEVLWDKGDRDELQFYFAYRVKKGLDRPTNSEFIANISDAIRLDWETENINY